MKKQKLLNAYVNNLSMEEVLYTVEHLIETENKSYIVPINVDVVMKMENDNYLKQISDDATLTLVDGQPLIWISKLFCRPIKEKISGSDLVPLLCERSARNGYSIFILGGKEGIAKQARENLEKRYKNIKIVDVYSPPLGFENNIEELEQIITRINNASPDLLIVCLGCPKQEKFIYENYSKYNARVSVCAGATVDFLAGNVKRAPKWMSNNGLEWFYRFMQEPKRLFKRYFVDDVKIVKLIWKYREN